MSQELLVLVKHKIFQKSTSLAALASAILHYFLAALPQDMTDLIENTYPAL